jgi:hypothetical protein
MAFKKRNPNAARSRQSGVVAEARQDVKNVAKGVEGSVMVIIVLVIALGVLGLGIWLANADFWSDWGSAATNTPMNIDKTAIILNILLGKPSDQDGAFTEIWTYEMLIIRIVIFLIMMFALADILQVFTSFQAGTSWVIGFGLGVIAGVTGTNAAIANIFGFSAGVGAIGIMIIVLGGIAAAIVLNLGIGGKLREWRVARQIDIERNKSRQGWASVGDAVQGLKATDEAAKDG